MPELKPLQKYVYGKNELDEKVEKLEEKIRKLNIDSHPPKFTEAKAKKLEKRLKRVEIETFGKKYKFLEGSD